MHPLRTSTLRGFSIVEAMVALLVLSIGMLGIAGLYVTTLRASGSALLRTHAVNLAADMADRIRANPTAGAAYAGGAADNSCAGGGVDCSPTQLAADDLFTARTRSPRFCRMTVIPPRCRERSPSRSESAHLHHHSELGGADGAAAAQLRPENADMKSAQGKLSSGLCRRYQRGLSMIELMVALTIGSFLIAGTVFVYVQSRNSYGVNETVARLQETGRFALSIIEPDVRMSSYWGLMNDPELITGRAAQDEAIPQ
jgi:prepilin-type N-terminal cleavage/methylation domain-containing protein